MNGKKTVCPLQEITCYINVMVVRIRSHTTSTFGLYFIGAREQTQQFIYNNYYSFKFMNIHNCTGLNYEVKRTIYENYFLKHVHQRTTYI